jgi:hypothetical protein
VFGPRPLTRQVPAETRDCPGEGCRQFLFLHSPTVPAFAMESGNGALVMKQQPSGEGDIAGRQFSR